jgi:hypothetical protein
MTALVRSPSILTWIVTGRGESSSNDPIARRQQPSSNGHRNRLSSLSDATRRAIEGARLAGSWLWQKRDHTREADSSE